MESSSSENASDSIVLRNILNTVGASTHPCLTPFVTGKVSDDWPLLRTHARMLSWSECITVMNLGGQPNFDLIFQNSS